MESEMESEAEVDVEMDVKRCSEIEVNSEGPRREYKYSYHNTLHCLFHTTLQDMTISSRFCPVFGAWILVFRVWCRVSLCWLGLVCVDLHWLLCDEMEWGL